MTIDDLVLTDVSKESEVSLPTEPSALQVTAFLIYEDNSISNFDILNCKNLALWNTKIGGGDALKPSSKTKIILNGKLNGLKLLIYNGKREMIDEDLPDFSGVYEYILEDTGCEEVKIVVSKYDQIVFQDIIPFKCGSQ